MDAFSYLSVLLSIVLGLALTHVLSGLGRLVQARRRIRVYWPSVVWAALLVVMAIQVWWAMFGLRTHTNWTFGGFLIAILKTIVVYMLAALVLPESANEGITDLRENYFGHSRWFFGFLVLAFAVSLLHDRVLNGTWPDRPGLAFLAVGAVMYGGAAVARSERYHKAVALVSTALYALYIATMFPRLQ